MPSFAQELALLFDDCKIGDSLEKHEAITAPVFTRDAYLASGIAEGPSQYGVLGRVLSVK